MTRQRALLALKHVAQWEAQYKVLQPLACSHNDNLLLEPDEQCKLCMWTELDDATAALPASLLLSLDDQQTMRANHEILTI